MKQQRLPFLRWSTWRLALGMPHFCSTGQIGDGREAAVRRTMSRPTRAAATSTTFSPPSTSSPMRSRCWSTSATRRARCSTPRCAAPPRTLVLELGTYCGYSALRIARAAPAARVCSVEFSAANAEVARRIWAHAGVATASPAWSALSATAVRRSTRWPAEYGFTAGGLDLMFIDHDKRAYLTDLQSILDRGWLHAGSIVVADNVRVPGAPKYRAYMREPQGTLWNTVEHKTHVEYQSLLPDLVLESEYLG